MDGAATTGSRRSKNSTNHTARKPSASDAARLIAVSRQYSGRQADSGVAAGLNSAYTPALAKTAVAAMEACVKSCKPHIEHHAECKGCHDACLVAIDAIRKMS